MKRLWIPTEVVPTKTTRPCRQASAGKPAEDCYRAPKSTLANDGRGSVCPICAVYVLNWHRVAHDRCMHEPRRSWLHPGKLLEEVWNAP